MADPGSGARPRLVCNSTPVALITGVRPNAVSAARPIATVRISSSDGGAAPAAALARTSLKVVRSIRELDGEVITRAEPVIGYMHRGAEKLAEFRDARQTLVLMNRHDWLSAFNNELGWTIAVERLADIEVPDRAQWIRTMFAE